MTSALAFDLALAALVLAIATLTIAAREAMSAVISFIAYGLLLSLAWVRLRAPDVALTEAAIGAGVTGLLLLGAAATVGQRQAGAAPPLALMLAAGLACALVASGLAATTLLLLPEPAPTLAPPAMASLATTGLGNPVTAVLFVYRALDTLLEKVVLVLALLGVWSLAPDRMWGGVARLGPDAPPRAMLVYLAQLLPPVGMLIAIYMFWTGADHPGGAFQGGAILAAMWLIVLTARLAAMPATSHLGLRLLVLAGPMLFAAIGFAGWALADAFLAYPEGYAKPLIILAEAGLTLSIAATLACLVAGPSAGTPPP